jgi:hypothetical protein
LKLEENENAEQEGINQVEKKICTIQTINPESTMEQYLRIPCTVERSFD